MARIAPIAGLLLLALLVAIVPDALAQAGSGTSHFSGGGGGGGGGGFSSGGGLHGSRTGTGTGPGAGNSVSAVYVLLFFVAFACIAAVPLLTKQRRARARSARDERVATASAAAAEDEPAFAADAVKAQAAALYTAIQRAWSERDDAALQGMLGPDLLVEWQRRLADFARKGWTNDVAILSGPRVDYVGLVNRAGSAEDRVTVAIGAKLRSVVRTSSGAVVTSNADADADGDIDVCEFWTLARSGDGWRLISIEQEKEGAHHLAADIVAAPSDDARIADESLVELAVADAPPPDVAAADLVSVEFDGTAHEQALDLSLADPRYSPAVLEVAARRAVEAWAEAVDGDDAALLAVATPQAARDLLYPAGSAGDAGTARIVVRGPQLLRLAITSLHADRVPSQMEVEARVRGRRYVEQRDTAAVLAGVKDRDTQFTERWTFELDAPASGQWRLVGSVAERVPTSVAPPV